MKKIFLINLFTLLVAMAAAQSVTAQESSDEARYLISIANEIENIKTLATKAAANTDIESRTRFDYAALQDDLEQMQKAIERHAMEPSRTPRTVSLLHDDYTRKVNDE